MVRRLCRWGIFACTTVINLMTCFFGCCLLTDIRDEQHMMYVAVRIVLTAIFLATVFSVIGKITSKVTGSNDMSTAETKIYQILNISSLIVFFAYLFVFIYAARDMQRGSEPYMTRALPNFLPWFSGLILFFKI